jgi:hypothetical protein
MLIRMFMVPLVCRQSPKPKRSEASRRAHSQNLRHAPEIPLLFPPNTPTHWRRATNTPESARTDCRSKRGPASAKQATHVALTADRPQRGAYLESKQQPQRGFVFHSSHGLKSNNRGSASASESFKVRHARERAHRLRTQKRIRISQASHTCGLRETNHSFVRAGVDVSRAYIRVHIMCTCVCLTPTILWHYCQ